MKILVFGVGAIGSHMAHYLCKAHAVRRDVQNDSSTVSDYYDSDNYFDCANVRDTLFNDMVCHLDKSLIL